MSCSFHLVENILVWTLAHLDVKSPLYASFLSKIGRNLALLVFFYSRKAFTIPRVFLKLVISASLFDLVDSWIHARFLQTKQEESWVYVFHSQILSV
jgi:hypothetical protein